MKRRMFFNKLKTGAKKALVTTSLVATLLGINIPTAYADVKVSNIVPDDSISMDRSQVRQAEKDKMVVKFTCDNELNLPFVTPESVVKACELSDVLNNYKLDFLLYTNTKASEVENLNVDALYEEYSAISTLGDPTQLVAFCERNLVNKPAIDAYVTFGGQKVAEGIKNSLAGRLCAGLEAEGHMITFGPFVCANETEIYALAEIDGQLQKISLVGEDCENLRQMCNTLDSSYTKAINSISGQSDEFENCFVYNGVEKTTGESAWFSLPDDDKKALIRQGADISTKLTMGEEYSATIMPSDMMGTLSEADKNMLTLYGYDASMISEVPVLGAMVEKIELVEANTLTLELLPTDQYDQFEQVDQFEEPFPFE